MTLLFPLGLLVLLGIPVVVLVYIIKNKYTEQTISSTYLWNLSEKFLKRRLPISKLAGIISLILQILAILLIALAASHPVLTLKDSANAYCYVLDASGSMNLSLGDRTRFEEGKRRIRESIGDAADGSLFTVFYAGSSVETVFENISDKDRAASLLEDLLPQDEAGSLDSALEAAQEYFGKTEAAKIVLVTDRQIEKTQNLEYIYVGGEAENYALSNAEALLSGEEFLVRGTVVSYQSDATLHLELLFNDEEQGSGSLTAEVKRGEEQPFEFILPVSEKTNNYQKIRVLIKEEDALALDNEAILYNTKMENVSKILLVSDTPFFVSAALLSAGYSQFETISSSDYRPATGYGLYIFESFLPEALPQDGAVWIFNPKKSLSGANFSYQGESEAKSPAVYSESTASTVKNLLTGVQNARFELYKYSKCGLNGNFQSLITCDGNPILFVGTNGFGNREVVFAFDVKDSAPFVFHADYTTLINNLLSYSFPSAFDGEIYTCGDVLQINRIAGCESIRVETPRGGKEYPDTSVSLIEYRLKEAGSYRINLIMKDGSERTLNVFVALPEEERVPLQTEAEAVILGGEKGNMDGIFDEIWILFLILALLIVADFGVYCYEQYQLR